MLPDKLITPGSVINFSFKTHNGDIQQRRVVFRGVYFGSSPHFPESEDWFLLGLCLDKNVERAFKVSNIRNYLVE